MFQCSTAPSSREEPPSTAPSAYAPLSGSAAASMLPNSLACVLNHADKEELNPASRVGETAPATRVAVFEIRPRLRARAVPGMSTALSSELRTVFSSKTLCSINSSATTSCTTCSQGPSGSSQPTSRRTPIILPAVDAGLPISIRACSAAAIKAASSSGAQESAAAAATRCGGGEADS